MKHKENKRKPVPKKKTKRGGRRPGAGAPRGNMNALKTGAYSKQFSLLGKLIAQDPTVRAVLLNIAARAERKFKDANEVAAYLLTRWAERVEDMAEAKYASKGRRRRGKNLVLNSAEGPVPSSAEGTDRLSPELPIDDWDSVKQAAARYERKMRKWKIFAPGQSDTKYKPPKPISLHTRKPH